MDSINFSQMLCSRLCHDLITPIGAINTSLDLLNDSDAEDRMQLLELAKQSAEKAVRKLVFYRAAFGYSIDSHFSTFKQTKDLIQDFLMINKIKLFWNEENQADQTSCLSSQLSTYGQLIANLAFICSEIAPSGGKLLIEFTKRSSQEIHLKLEGKLVLLRPAILSALTGHLSEDETSPHIIQAIYTHKLCRKLHIDLNVHQEERVYLDLSLNVAAEKNI